MMRDTRHCLLAILVAALGMSGGASEARAVETSADSAAPDLHQRVDAVRERLSAITDEMLDADETVAQWYNWPNWQNWFNDWRNW